MGCPEVIISSENCREKSFLGRKQRRPAVNFSERREWIYEFKEASPPFLRQQHQLIVTAWEERRKKNWLIIMVASHALLRQMMLSLELWLLSCWLYLYNRWIRSPPFAIARSRARATLYTDSAWNELTALARAATSPTTTRFGWLNARKKHNLPYIETIHIQLDRERTFYHRGVENAQVISQKKDAAANPLPITCGLVGFTSTIWCKYK